MSSERPYYHEFAWAYDLLQTDPVAPRIDFVEGVLSRHGIGTRATILDAGCGTGRYALELARRGYHVRGVDRSPELIAIAQKRAIEADLCLEFVLGDLMTISFTRPFDAILCRGVLNDVVEESDRTAIFRQFAVWLRPAGVAIFDVREWTRTVARYEKNSVHRRTVKLLDGTLRFHSETALDSKTHHMRIRECFEVSRNDGETSRVNDFVMRCWTPEEVERQLLIAGFDLTRSSPSYGESDQAWSDRLVLIARKRSA